MDKIMSDRPRTPTECDPLSDQREAARRERVERLLGTVPKLTTGKAMRFTKTAQRAAERKVGGYSNCMSNAKAGSVPQPRTFFGKKSMFN